MITKLYLRWSVPLSIHSESNILGYHEYNVMMICYHPNVTITQVILRYIILLYVGLALQVRNALESHSVVELYMCDSLAVYLSSDDMQMIGPTAEVDNLHQHTVCEYL